MYIVNREKSKSFGGKQVELTEEVIKQYHLDILKCATLEEKQNMFLSQVRNNKDFAVLQHRKMWIWIAQQYAKGRKTYVADLKREYIKEYCFNANVLNNCFCCEYSEDIQSWSSCLKCPILWKNIDCSATDRSEYSLIVEKSNILCDNPIPENIEGFLKSSYFMPKRYYIMAKEAMKQRRKCAKLAYKISQLPERKEENEN